MNTTIVDSTVISHSDINQASNGQVVRRKNLSSVIISILILLLGLALLIVANRMEDHTTSTYLACLVFGVSALLVGGAFLIFGGKKFVYLPTASKVDIKSYFFESNQFNAISQAIKDGDCTVLKSLKRSENSGIRVDLFSSADKQFAGVQVYQYVPYTYTPASPLYCFYDNRSSDLIEVFSK